ncbi:MAG TPA: hypothetical protein VLB44_07790 [Kofleriaceae bacterium]|nr:hypothetical protein [Kofleriaceae bacterium]
MRSIWGSLLLVLFVVACSKEDPAGRPIDVAAWVKKNGAEAEAFRGKLDAAVTLVKDLPATSVHVADPEVPFMFERDTSPAWENAVLVSGVYLRGLPEYGRDKGKTVDSGDQTISVNYWGMFGLALEDLFALLDGGKPEFTTTQGGGEILMKQIRAVRYVLIAHEVSYKPGEIDTENKTFTAGTYEGVVHVVDLKGPKHLGSVAFSAKNTGKFESYSGSEKFMLRADLESESMKAFRAEWPKVFPKHPLPTPRE